MGSAFRRNWPRLGGLQASYLHTHLAPFANQEIWRDVQYGESLTPKRTKARKPRKKNPTAREFYDEIGHGIDHVTECLFGVKTVSGNFILMTKNGISRQMLRQIRNLIEEELEAESKEKGSK